MSADRDENRNGPARGPSFSVVAPAIGVCVFLAALAASRCDAERVVVTSPPPLDEPRDAVAEPGRDDAR